MGNAEALKRQYSTLSESKLEEIAGGDPKDFQEGAIDLAREELIRRRSKTAPPKSRVDDRGDPPRCEDCGDAGEHNRLITYSIMSARHSLRATPTGRGNETEFRYYDFRPFKVSFCDPCYRRRIAARYLRWKAGLVALALLALVLLVGGEGPSRLFALMLLLLGAFIGYLQFYHLPRTEARERYKPAYIEAMLSGVAERKARGERNLRLFTPEELKALERDKQWTWTRGGIPFDPSDD